MCVCLVWACVWVCAYLHYCMFCVPRSHRRLPPRDSSGASDYHRPDARPATNPAQPRPRHHADPHASDSPDPELSPRTRSQSAPGAGAARARIWNHLHAVRVSLHTHALHIGIPDWLNWSIRYLEIESSSLSYMVNGCIMRTGYLTSNQSCSTTCILTNTGLKIYPVWGQYNTDAILC